MTGMDDQDRTTIDHLERAAVERPERLAAVGLADLEAPLRRRHRRRQEAAARRARRQAFLDDLFMGLIAIAGTGALTVLAALFTAGH